MKPQSTTIIPFTLVVFLSLLHGIALADNNEMFPQCLSPNSFHGIALADNNEKFLQCLSSNSENTSSISQVIYTQNNPSYPSVYDFLKQNLRTPSPTYLEPEVVVTPFKVSQIQAVLKCAQEHGLQIRVRSGGHDYEGLASISEVPFVLIDMVKFSSIDVDVEEKTAWVGAGVTLGELYYRIGQKSRSLACAAGLCPTVGVGGHFSGGGYGYLGRKFGLATDQIIDAHLIDVNGRILDRKLMGEDLFWAIRGGGVASFGILVAWKLNLVDVPSTVTVFAITKTLEQNATMIFHKWQHIAHQLPKDAFLSASIRLEGNRTILVRLISLFLGGIDSLLSLMKEKFPELGLMKEDCKEMAWVESTAYLSSIVLNNPLKLEALLDRNNPKIYTKTKSDYLKEPIPVKVLEGLYDILEEEGGHNIVLECFPYGGRMGEISETATAFPHRAGNKYIMVYYANWQNREESQRTLDLNKKLYSYMTPYISENPREAYFNCKDLDIGRNNEGDKYTSLEEAEVWGTKYFKNNFYRLVDVKTMVDPGNFFRNEQSILPMSLSIKKTNH